MWAASRTASGAQPEVQHFPSYAVSRFLRKAGWPRRSARNKVRSWAGSSFGASPNSA
jgi:hypothetical protein